MTFFLSVESVKNIKFLIFFLNLYFQLNGAFSWILIRTQEKSPIQTEGPGSETLV